MGSKREEGASTVGSEGVAMGIGLLQRLWWQTSHFQMATLDVGSNRPDMPVTTSLLDPPVAQNASKIRRR